MTLRKNPECLIWPRFPAVHVARNPVADGLVCVEGSPRAGGDYAVTACAEQRLSGGYRRIDERVRARLTTILVDERASGEEWPTVTTDLIERATNAADLTLETRADRLLQYLRTTIDSDPLPIPFLETDVWTAALAHSESTTIRELDRLFQHLEKQGWVVLPTIDKIRYEPTITGSGIDRSTTLSHADRSPVGFGAT